MMGGCRSPHEGPDPGTEGAAPSHLTYFLSPLTSYLSPLTSYLSPLTSHVSPTSAHQGRDQGAPPPLTDRQGFPSSTVPWVPTTWKLPGVVPARIPTRSVLVGVGRWRQTAPS